MIVLDSSVVLVLAFMEPGWDAVPWGQDDLCISTVCLVEVVSKLVDRSGNDLSIRAFLEPLGIAIAPLTETQAISAGMLRATTRQFGLSRGDRCCLALAMELRAPVMTADRAWAGLDLGVEVRVIRKFARIFCENSKAGSQISGGQAEYLCKQKTMRGCIAAAVHGSALVDAAEGAE